MYATASRVLRAAGHEHYEVSSYAQRGHRSAHNQAYWRGHSYYAFGLGAASFLHGARFSRPRTLDAWRRYVHGLQDACTGADRPQQYWAGQGCESLTVQDRMLESVMLMLRTSDGIQLAWFAHVFGVDRAAALLRGMQKHLAAGTAEVIGRGERRLSMSVPIAMIDGGCEEWEAQDLTLRLCDPEGLLLSNHVISDVFACLT
jgi:coproporphyrinogen III oxidase-like Fe-S oxidoreductase